MLSPSTIINMKMNKLGYIRKYNKGNKHSVFIAFVVFARLVFISLLPINIAFANEALSVGVVNVTFLMENAPQAEVASSQLKTKFLPQEESLAKGLEAINSLELELKEIITLKGSDDLKRQKEREIRSRKRSRSRSLQDFREELRFARDSALDVVQKEVFNAIDEVRKEKKIDIVLQDYVSASQRVDITPLVLEFLKKKLESDINVGDK